LGRKGAAVLAVLERNPHDPLHRSYEPEHLFDGCARALGGGAKRLPLRAMTEKLEHSGTEQLRRRLVAGEKHHHDVGGELVGRQPLPFRVHQRSQQVASRP
jgi:hypothetical protein